MEAISVPEDVVKHARTLQPRATTVATVETLIRAVCVQFAVRRSRGAPTPEHGRVRREYSRISSLARVLSYLLRLRRGLPHLASAHPQTNSRSKTRADRHE